MGFVYMPGPIGAADNSAVTASAEDVLYGKVIVDKNGNPITGKIPDYSAGSLLITLNPGERKAVSTGYYKGLEVLANPASYAGTALPTDVISGRTFYSNGSSTIQSGSVPDYRATTMPSRFYWNDGTPTDPAGVLYMAGSDYTHLDNRFKYIGFRTRYGIYDDGSYVAADVDWIGDAVRDQAPFYYINNNVSNYATLRTRDGTAIGEMYKGARLRMVKTDRTTTVSGLSGTYRMMLIPVYIRNDYIGEG